MKTPAHSVFAFLTAPARARLVSPCGLASRAGLLAVVYLACEIAGLRDYTTFLSGTEQASTWSATVLGGVAYLAAYFGAVLLAPILLLTAALLGAWQRFSRRARP
jgi:hypothetical protein